MDWLEEVSEFLLAEQNAPNSLVNLYWLAI
jgi:hypothetical protein